MLAAMVAATMAALVSCSNRKVSLLPNVSGKAGEVLVVIDREPWEGDLGTEIRAALSKDCPYLAQREPLFNVSNVPAGSFTNMFKVHRNILVCNIDPQLQTPGVVYKHDHWARPQAVVQINAADEAAAVELFRQDEYKITEFFEQAERNRIIDNAMLYEATELREPVERISGGTMHFPSGYKLKKDSEDFVWIADDKQYVYQDVMIFRYPASGKGNFEEKTLLDNINRALMENVPGMFENTYMTTSTAIEPTFASLKYKGLDFMQVRGFWEVENDYMGGPFVAHAFYSRDGKDIIVMEAFVYAPRYDKRRYLRQVESLLYSFEWKEEK